MDDPNVQIIYIKEESSGGGFLWWFTCLVLLSFSVFVGLVIYCYFLAKRQISSTTTTGTLSSAVSVVEEGMVGVQMGREIIRGFFFVSYSLPFALFLTPLPLTLFSFFFRLLCPWDGALCCSFVAPSVSYLSNRCHS